MARRFYAGTWARFKPRAAATVIPTPVVTLSPLTAIGLQVGVPFARVFSASGGTAPYTISLIGSLPSGLALAGASLSGTPTTAGAFSFGIRATDAAGFASAIGAFSGTVQAEVVVTPPADTTPDAFAFTDVTNATLGAPQASNTITVAGINAPATMTVTGGVYYKNGGSASAVSTTVVAGDTVSVGHTASSSNSTAVNTVLTIGGVSDTFTSTTAAAAGPATLDPTLSAPVLIDRTSGGVIAFDAGIESDYAVGDKVYLIAKNKAGTVVLTFSDVVSLAEATDTSAGTSGKVTFSGLSAVSLSTTYRWSLYVEKAGGATYGPSSATVKTGPDDQEPTLTLPTKTNVGATSATLGFTTDEAGTRYSVLVPSAEATPTNTQVKAGQKADGTAAPITSTGAATLGANTFAISGTTASTAYKVCTVVEDAFSNLSAVLTDTYTTLASDPSFAKLVNGNGATGAGINRSRYIVSTDFTATATGGIGVMCPVKSTDAPPPKFHFEITLTAAPASTERFQLGVTDAATDFDDGGDFYRLPGDSAGARPGSTLRLTCGGAGGDRFVNGSAAAVGGSSPTVQGDIFSVDVDRTTNTVVYKRKRVSDGAVETIGTYVLTSQIPTDWRAFVGVESNTVTLTVNFGASAFAITPLSGHTGW